MTKRDAAIGSFLFILPFVIFTTIFWCWPSPGGPALERWFAATRKIVALNEQLTKDQGALTFAETERDKQLQAPEAEKKTLQSRVDEATRSLNKTNQGLAAARDLQTSSQRMIENDNNDLALGQEMRLCILVVLAGALGASVSAARGFAVHAGRNDYDAAWRWWYLLRLPTGCGIAFILYAVLRAGLVPWKLDEATTALDNVNPYGFVAIGALGGMFANEAFQKLQEVLAAIMGSGAGPAVSARPTITSVALTSAGNRKDVTISGTNFAKGATVKVNDEPWSIDPKDIKVTEIKATGPSDLPVAPVETKIELSFSGPPAQTVAWKGKVA